MLELLHIENIAVIESADISFRPGFNALTGETGAGKSIVIDAMSARSILPPCPGPITVSAAMTTVQARSQPSGRQRRPFGASAPSVMSWVSYTNGWNPFAVKYMTLPRRFGINGQNLPFLPRSWTPRRPGLTSFTA